MALIANLRGVKGHNWEVENMKTAFKSEPFTFDITAKLKESGVRFSFAKRDDESLHNCFKVRVKLGKKSRSFDFFDSTKNYEDGKETLTDEDLKYAFRAFLSDAQSGAMTFSEFCDEFGYDKDSRTAEKSHNICQRAKYKLLYLGVSSKDVENILEALRADGIE